MSFNLTAHTKKGKKIELFQLNTAETFHCLGYKWSGVRYEQAENLNWRQIRDRYIACIVKKHDLTPALDKHTKKLKSQPFIGFSLEGTMKLEVELSEIQFHVFLKSLDLYTRMLVGQLGSLSSEYRAEFVDFNCDKLNEIEHLLKNIEPLITGLPAGGYKGIRSSDIPESAKIAYDLYCAIRRLKDAGTHSVYAQADVLGPASQSAQVSPIVVKLQK
jgi:hypothetical protein